MRRQSDAESVRAKPPSAERGEFGNSSAVSKRSSRKRRAIANTLSRVLNVSTW